MSLGSWRTFEHLPLQAGAAILAAARDEGINFFDDARYNDETGRAPLPTGYSEVLFGELFRSAGVRRDEVVVANKLWWEFWPEQSAGAELDGSLARMGFDYVDLIYASPPPDGLAIADMVAAVGGLLDSGKARAWAVVNCQAGPLAEAVAAAAALGVAPPCAAQLPYSLVRRSWVEGAEMTEALHAAGAGVVASFCLEGGVLSGKYLPGVGAGRAAAALDDPGRPRPSPRPPTSPAWPPRWALALPRSRWPSRSPTQASPACCSARPARNSSGPTAPRPRCWTG
jgi:aryl-alcohol dehydrogenase-like predicted oxidoreductase